MGRWRNDAEAWLEAEQAGDEHAADAAFDRLFQAVPAVAPSPGFVARTVEAAWAARARRRWLVAAGTAAAAILLAATGVVVLYVALDARIASLLTTTAAFASGAVLWVITAGIGAADWWASAANAAGTMAGVLAKPYTLAALVAIELVAVAALILLHRLLRSEVGFRSRQAFSF